MSDVLRALSVMKWCSRHGFIHYPGVERDAALRHARAAHPTRKATR